MRKALLTVALVAAPTTVAVTVTVMAAAAVAVAGAQGPKVVDLGHEPSHHLALSNDHVRVFNVIVAPHATTLVHRHDHDYLFVTFGDADITSVRAGDTAVRLVLHDGEVRYAAGGFAHSATDNIDRPFHNSTIELLHPATHVQPCAGSCAEPAPCGVSQHGSCPTVTRLLAADQWTVVSVTLPPSARLDLVNGAGPALLVAVSDVRLARGGGASGGGPIRGAAGTLGWLAATPRPLTGRAAVVPRALINESGATTRFVMVEFLSGRS